MSDPTGSYYGRDRRDYTSHGGGHRGGARGGRGGGGRGGGQGGFRGGSHRGAFRGGGYRMGGGPHRGGGRGRGRGGPPRPGNRFSADSDVKDPKEQLLQSLSQMILHVGHIPPPPLDDSSEKSEDSHQSQGSKRFRSLVLKQAGNIQQLIPILLQNSPLFFDPNTQPLVVGLVHAIITMPLQTNCYVALFLRIIHERPSFASSLLEYSWNVWARLTDSLLLLQRDIYSSAVQAPRAMLSCRLLLRFWVIVSRHSNVLSWKISDDGGGAQGTPFDPVATASHSLRVRSVRDLLQSIVQASKNARDRHSNPSVAALLANVVLSCIPYVLMPKDDKDSGESERSWLLENVIEPLRTVLINDDTGTSAYGSLFAPGVGSCSILLRHEQDGDDSDEDEDDNDVDGEEPGQVCDHLQDLMRTVMHLVREDGSDTSQFLLFQDCPWEAFVFSNSADVATDQTDLGMPLTDQPMTLGSEEPTSDISGGAARMSYMDLAFTGKPVEIRIFPDCKSLTLLLGGTASAPNAGDVNSQVILKRNCLMGILIGRLPIFGPPPDLIDADEREEDEDHGDDMEDSTTPTSPRFEAYKLVGLVDRFFLSEAIRDVVLSQESFVTDTGIVRSSSKAVAEQVWSIASMMHNGGEGVEYCAVETIVSLIAQADRPPASCFRVVYLSRILLELTRLLPAAMSPALVTAVQNLVDDYMPSLAPIARQNLAQWFAYHLINTDYQWPHAYWKHWTPFVLHGWMNSRGNFVLSSMAYLVENTSQPERLVKTCLPPESSLADFLVTVPREPLLSSSLSSRAVESFTSFGDDVERRIWVYNEDAANLLSYICGNEARESVYATFTEEDRRTDLARWWRTTATIRAVLAPVAKEAKRLKKALDDMRASLLSVEEHSEMHDSDRDDEASLDTMPSVLDMLKRYHVLITAALAKDSEGTQSEESLLKGEVTLLDQVECLTIHSRSLLESSVQALLWNETIQPLSLLRWVLNDQRCVGTSSDSTGRAFLARWWDIAAIAIEFVTRPELSGDSSMMDEDDARGPLSRVKALIDRLEPLVTCALDLVSRRHTGLGATKAKLSPTMVESIEGMKKLLFRIRVVFHREIESSSKTTEPVSRIQEALEVLSQSSISGSALAAQFEDSSSAYSMYSSFLSNVLKRFEFLEES